MNAVCHTFNLYLVRAMQFGRTVVDRRASQPAVVDALVQCGREFHDLWLLPLAFRGTRLSTSDQPFFTKMNTFWTKRGDLLGRVGDIDGLGPLLGWLGRSTTQPFVGTDRDFFLGKACKMIHCWSLCGVVCFSSFDFYDSKFGRRVLMHLACMSCQKVARKSS